MRDIYDFWTQAARSSVSREADKLPKTSATVRLCKESGTGRTGGEV
jgi:hypothetical protein